MERKAEPTRVPFCQTPLLKDQVMLPYQGQGMIERAQRCRRKNDIVERAARLESFHQIALAGHSPEQQVPDRISHAWSIGLFARVRGAPLG